MDNKLNIRQTLLNIDVGGEVHIPETAARMTTLRNTATILRADFGTVLHVNKASGYYRVWREA